MAVPVACEHGTRLCCRGNQGRTRDSLDRFTEAALHPRRCRYDAGDAAMDAAVLAKAVGGPVRMQYTREQGTGWDPKGPASIHRARAAIDSSGQVIAYEVMSKGV